MSYEIIGGPCIRQCQVDRKTLVCISCGMYFIKGVE